MQACGISLPICSKDLQILAIYSYNIGTEEFMLTILASINYSLYCIRNWGPMCSVDFFVCCQIGHGLVQTIEFIRTCACADGHVLTGKCRDGHSYNAIRGKVQSFAMTR